MIAWCSQTLFCNSSQSSITSGRSSRLHPMSMQSWCMLWSYANHSTRLWPKFCGYHSRFQLVGLSTPSMLTFCLKDPQMGDDNLSGTYSDSQSSSLEQVACESQLKDKKNSRLTINNYLLKHKGITIIRTIYIWMETVSLFVLFKRSANEIFGWCRLSMLIFWRVRLLFLERFLFLFSCL